MPTEEQIAGLVERVNKAEEVIKVARAELKTAERAGIDIQPQRTKLEETVTRLKRVKIAYNIS